MPDFKMIGDPLRRCLASGEWSGYAARCLELSEVDNQVLESMVDGTFGLGRAASAADLENSKMMGIGIAIAGGVVLILVIIIAFMCLKA